VLINEELFFKGIEQPTAYWIADIGQNDRLTLRTGEGDLPTLERLHVAYGASIIRRGSEKLFESFLGGGDSMIRPGLAETLQKAMMHSLLRLRRGSLRNIAATIESIESSYSLVRVATK
jgi:hypothetical protein